MRSGVDIPGPITTRLNWIMVADATVATGSETQRHDANARDGRQYKLKSELWKWHYDTAPVWI